MSALVLVFALSTTLCFVSPSLVSQQAPRARSPLRDDPNNFHLFYDAATRVSPAAAAKAAKATSAETRKGDNEFNDPLAFHLSYEQSWIDERSKEAKLAFYQAHVKRLEIDSHLLPPSPPISSSRVRKRKAGSRLKRRIYGEDDRRCIDPRTDAKRFPFTAVVKVSTGCTGTMISSRHVLTAAHCIHNRTTYVSGYSNLRVGRLRKNGKFRWHDVESTYLPMGWTRGSGDVAPLYDYAVLVLRKNKERTWMPINYSEEDKFGYGTKIFFSAFEDDRQSMCYRTCNVLQQDNDVLFFRCDAVPGSSGSGVYANPNGQRTVISVFSGNRWRMDSSGFYSHYNAAVRITSAKLKQICHWLQCCPIESTKHTFYQSRDDTCRMTKCHQHCPPPPPSLPTTPPPTTRPQAQSTIQRHDAAPAVNSSIGDDDQAFSTPASQSTVTAADANPQR